MPPGTILVWSGRHSVVLEMWNVVLEMWSVSLVLEIEKCLFCSEKCVGQCVDKDFCYS